jgi:hypothetical protein
MAHIRTQIRNALKVLLTGLTTTGANVKVGQMYPLDKDQLPALLIYSNTHTIEQNATVELYEHKLQATVDILLFAKDDYDEKLDVVLVEIEQALAGDSSLGGLVSDLVMSAIDIEYSYDGEKPLARCNIKIDIDFETTFGDPENTL